MDARRNFLAHKVTRLVVGFLAVGFLAMVVVSVGPLIARANSSVPMPNSIQDSGQHSGHMMQAGTVTSNASGKWSDPNIWSSGSVPQAGDAVVIREGDTVTYDVLNDMVLNQVTINGVLYFSREVNTRLKLNNHLVVQGGGTLDMGTPTDYMPPQIKAEVTFVLSQDQANAFVGSTREQNDFGEDHGGDHGENHGGMTQLESPDIGLWVMAQGRWDVHGAPLLRSWSKLAGDVAGGAQTLVVENNVGDWRVGGQIVVTSTRNPTKYYTRASDGRELAMLYNENEVRKIQSLEVLENGQTRITLDQPLAAAHSGTEPLRGEVALLTRNVVVSTELAGVSDFADVRNRKFAHTMFMVGAEGNLEYAEFKRLGHYGKLGRYAIHYHRMLESSEGMVARGNSIWETGFRCINVHISHGLLIEDNVCYDSTSSAYFVEADGRKESAPPGYQRGYSEDIAFVHNIAIGPNPKHFEDRNNTSRQGESRRMAAYWPGSETSNEVYLGNIAVGGREYLDSAGFGFPEDGNDVASQGEIPFTFVSNEVHSSANFGIFSWQNLSLQRDMVDTLLWRNGDAAIRWGAYNMPAYYFNAQLLENGRSALDITSVNAFIQDSTITGSLADGSKVDRGFAVTGYVLPQYPNPGAWIVRNDFKDLQTSGVSQPQLTLKYDNADGTECKMHDFIPNPPYSVRLRPVWPGECSGVYLTLMGNSFENVAHPLVFGSPPNANTYWKVFDYESDQASPNPVDYDDFVLIRADQAQSDKQGIVTQKLVTPDAEANSEFSALVVPMSSLPQEGITFTGIPNHREANQQHRSKAPDFVFATQADYPPSVALDVTVNGESVTLTALATDDKGINRIEFFVDWTLVATQTVAAGTLNTTQEITIDLANHPRKYAYLYVRAFDGTRQFGNYEQRAYSNVIEIGPEILGMAANREEPQEPSGPGGVANPREFPSRMFLPMLAGDD